MLLRNYFIFSDDKIIVFFIVSRSFPLKSYGDSAKLYLLYKLFVYLLSVALETIFRLSGKFF